MAIAAYLTEHVVPVLIGRDPARIEDTWQYLYKGAYWRRGPVTMSAIAAVDLAIPDFGLQEYMRHTDATTRSSRTRTGSPTATCIPARNRGSAWTSTRNSPRGTRTGRRRCR